MTKQRIAVYGIAIAIFLASVYVTISFLYVEHGWIPGILTLLIGILVPSALITMANHRGSHGD
ncbi:MAG TPA: hypothetical protein VFZ66_29575 [Herpetosiphonaceae bacterium]